MIKLDSRIAGKENIREEIRNFSTNVVDKNYEEGYKTGPNDAYANI